MSSNNTIIQIPIKPHLKKYLYFKLGTKKNIIQISTSDPINFGFAVLSLTLRKNEYLYYCDKKKFTNFINSLDRNCFITISIGPYYIQSAGLFFTDQKIFYLNKFIEKQFRNELYSNVNWSYVKDPKTVKEYDLEDLINFFNINEDEIKKESIVRDFHRNTQKYQYFH